MTGVIVCECGKQFNKPGELANVHSEGLALVGTCPSCGARLACAELWTATRREAWQPKAPAKVKQNDAK